MDISAVVPTLGERSELMPLITQLIKEKVNVIVLGCPNIRNIHTIWNQGARLARAQGSSYIAIINDDIVLPANTLKYMKRAMKENNLAVVGVDPSAKFGLPIGLEVVSVEGNVAKLMLEVTTWCFMVDARAWVDIDEEYEWWWGVGDLFVNISEAGGKLGKILGLGIVHVGSGTARNHNWTKVAAHKDALRWQKKHPNAHSS